MKKIVNISSLSNFKHSVEVGQDFTRIWYYKDEVQREYSRRVSRKLAKGFYIDDTELGKKVWVDFMSTNDWYFEDGYIYMIYNHLAAYDKAMKTLETEEEKEDFKKRYSDFLSKLYSNEFKRISKPIGIKEERRVEFFKVLAIYKLSES